MRHENILIISLCLFFLILPLTSSAAPKSADGEPCMVNNECSSGRCYWDYNSTNGKFCAEDFWTCVHRLDNDTLATQYDDDEILDDWRCDKGDWKEIFNNFDTDNDGVVNSIDECPGTSWGCKVSNGMINASNGCPFVPYAFTTNLEDTGNTTCIIGSFGVFAEPLCDSDAELDITYVLGGIAKKTCDTEGDPTSFWTSNNLKHMCRIEDLLTPGSGTFGLYASYKYPYDRMDFIANITINNDCNPTEPCTAGWRIIDGTEELESKLAFSSSYYIDGSDYVCCQGTSVGVVDINILNARCADGSPLNQTPGIVGWVYYDEGFSGLSINNAYSIFSGRCIRHVERDELIGEDSKEVGYIPVTDCSSSSLIGDTTIKDKTNSYILDTGGTYYIVADMVHAVCTSPFAYICPWESPSRQSDLCKMDQFSNWKEGNGWLEYENYTIRVLSPSVDMSATAPEMTYYVSDPYTPPQTNIFIWNISNSGIGDISLEDITVECPPELDCQTTPSPTIAVDEGQDIIIQTEFNLICDYDESEFPLKLSFTAKDNYGLGCLSSETETLIAKVIQGSVSDDSVGACECYTGKTDMWDSSNGCCDKGDCWSSADSTWICNDGTRVDGILFCEKYPACGKDWYWNKTFWQDKIPEGCPCSSSTECDDCDCVAGVCMNLDNPGLSFYSDAAITARLGETITTPVIIKNNLPVSDSIKVSISSSPAKLSYWTRFENHETEMVVDVGPFAEKSIPLEIFCGEIGSYELTMTADSLLSSSLHTESTKRMNIVALDSGMFSRTPGMSFTALIFTIAISVMVSQKRKND